MGFYVVKSTVKVWIIRWSHKDVFSFIIGFHVDRICYFNEHHIIYLFRWFCQLDDDNYLNIPNLLRLLDSYPSDKDLYLGRSSLNHPIETMDRENDMVNMVIW